MLTAFKNFYSAHAYACICRQHHYTESDTELLDTGHTYTFKDHSDPHLTTTHSTKLHIVGGPQGYFDLYLLLIHLVGLCSLL